MASSAKFLSTSLEEVEDRVIAYFAARFRTDPKTVLSTTDLKTRFNFNDAAWAGLAETFSAMGWMQRLHVRLAQAEMPPATTVEKLTLLIWKKVPKLVPMEVEMASVERLDDPWVAKKPRRNRGAKMGTSKEPVAKKKKSAARKKGSTQK